MTEHNGLRFDIYERVHLAEEGIGIAELEEAELLPYIEVYSNGEQAVLRGSLLLTGKYLGEDEFRSSVELQHSIPVEISIPMTRVSRLEDIQVEIENFDIDVLSNRSLNVTGLLTLRGVQLVTETVESRWDEEEIVAVHQTEDVRELYNPRNYPLDAEPSISAAEYYEQLNQQTQGERPLYPWETESRENESQGESTPYTGTASYNTLLSEPVSEDYNAVSDPEAYAYDAGQRTEQEVYYSAEAQVQAEEEPNYNSYEQAGYAASYGQQEQQESAYSYDDSSYDRNQENYVAEEYKEPKLAFGVKRDQEVDPSAPAPYGLQNLIHTSAPRDADAGEEETEAYESAAYIGGSSGDELQWKNLFLANATEETSFRKLRMCIVQREETISTIAERYNLNPREIALYNRLDDQTVSAGQVLYIPR
ncbi:hypothetical protein SY83_13785 [Paenibacillus swuensis]|uniref:LysM domain-containing protein n=1 Tax=Paenibacillus swuensis TaxID=1178515 RepID=A0A172TJF5_9BACL|nr:LysM peptidoglycan-binding domain-containing protein [Paenibacillus swuensis]ANE47158.1 hypothetical protein SY83_13785 [Paenibacillus swuensis]